MRSKRFTILLFVSLFAIGVIAQDATQAKKILDKTSAIVGRKGGASASFSMTSGKYGNASGTVAIKGNKFCAKTAQAIVWFNGKTQWTYLKKSNEVNVSTPTQAQQMSMNPYTFINIYKTGYTLGMKKVSGNYEIHLTAQNQKRTIQEMYVTIDKNYQPKQVKMRQGASWTTISISNFKAQNQSDKTFTFNLKDFPSAEVIDLR